MSPELQSVEEGRALAFHTADPVLIPGTRKLSSITREPLPVGYALLPQPATNEKKLVLAINAR